MKFTQLFCLIGAVSAVKLTASNEDELNAGSLAQEMVYDAVNMDAILAQAESEVNEDDEEARYRPSKQQLDMIANHMLKQLDKNGDGKVTKADIWVLVNQQLKNIPPKYRAQVHAQMKKHIDRMWKQFDTNGDGVFSHSEAVAFIKKMMN